MSYGLDPSSKYYLQSNPPRGSGGFNDRFSWTEDSFIGVTYNNGKDDAYNSVKKDLNDGDLKLKAQAWDLVHQDVSATHTTLSQLYTDTFNAWSGDDADEAQKTFSGTVNSLDALQDYSRQMHDGVNHIAGAVTTAKGQGGGGSGFLSDVGHYEIGGDGSGGDSVTAYQTLVHEINAGRNKMPYQIERQVKGGDPSPTDPPTLGGDHNGTGAGAGSTGAGAGGLHSSAAAPHVGVGSGPHVGSTGGPKIGDGPHIDTGYPPPNTPIHDPSEPPINPINPIHEPVGVGTNPIGGGGGGVGGAGFDPGGVGAGSTLDGFDPNSAGGAGGGAGGGSLGGIGAGSGIGGGSGLDAGGVGGIGAGAGSGTGTGAGAGGAMGSGAGAGAGAGGAGAGAGAGGAVAAGGRGGMMGGHGGGGDEEERDRSTWLTEDEDVWGGSDANSGVV